MVSITTTNARIKDGSPFLEISSNSALDVEEDKEGFFVPVVSDKRAEARPTSIIPQLEPGADLEAARLVVVAVALLEMLVQELIVRGRRR